MKPQIYMQTARETKRELLLKTFKQNEAACDKADKNPLAPSEDRG